MASGHVNRTYRPNTWLHRPMLLQNVQKALANSEPSTRPHMALFCRANRAEQCRLSGGQTCRHMLIARFSRFDH